MSASEHNQYLSPSRRPRDGMLAPSAAPVGTFGTAPRFWESPQTPSNALHARSPTVYLPSQRGAPSTTPARQRGYAQLALARGNVAQAGTFAPRSKTPAAPRYASRPSTPYTVLERRAVTPPSRAPASAPYLIPIFPAPGVLPRPATAGSGAGSNVTRQQSQKSGRRGGLFDTAIVARSPGWPNQTFRMPEATISPVLPSVMPSYATPKPASKTPSRPLPYGDSPYATVTPAYPMIPTAGTVGMAALPGPSGRTQPLTSTRPVAAALKGRFQDPGDDWLSSYEQSSSEVLRELERILGGLSSLTGLGPAPMEGQAPPRQLPSGLDRPSPLGAPTLAHSPTPPGSSTGPQSQGGASSFLNAGSDVQGAAWSSTSQMAAGPSGLYTRPTWGEPALATLSPPGALQQQQQQQLSTMSMLLGTYPMAAGRSAARGQTEATAAAVAPITAYANPIFAPTVSTQENPKQVGATSGPQAGSHKQSSGDASSQPSAAPSSQALVPAAAAQSSGAMSSLTPTGLPPNTVAEIWSILQACNKHTSRLVADLAAARREAEIANERAEEADSLARAFQQQLISRQKAVASWQVALAEMEEREEAARKQLLGLQERCTVQAQRAQQAEHVAATAQLRLERLMAAQRVGQLSCPGSPGGSPPRQQQQQLEHLHADLAAAKTRATLAELELAVARNKALIAQQELSTEEERARRAAAAAVTARQELGRTRAALEMMGLDHDRLQNQLAELRGKIGDAARWPPRSNSNDLLGHSDEPQPTQPAAVPQEPAGTSVSPVTAQGAGAGRTDGSDRGSSSHLSVAYSAAVEESGTGSASPAGASRALHVAMPSGGSAAATAVVGRPSNRPSLLLVQSNAARSANNSSNSSGDVSRSSSPSRRDASGASRRRRGGSVLLVPPGEMPQETSASVRYGQRLAIRRRSRSQDAGIMESPSGGDDDQPDGRMGSRGGASDGRMRSPRAMSGSHDGVVQRLNTRISEYSGGAAPMKVPGTAGVRQGNSENGKDSEEKPYAEAAGAPLLRTTGSLHRVVEMTEEMLPLTRTPSSGVRRRLPSLRTSQGSISRDVQPSARTPLPTHSPTQMQMGTSESLTIQGSAQKVSPVVAPAPVPVGEMPPLERDTVISKRVEARQPGRKPPLEAPSAPTAPSAATASYAAPSTPVKSSLQQQQQQAQTTNQQGSVTVSLADLRRQMAAATAAVTAAAAAVSTTAAPDSFQVIQRHRTSSGLTAKAGDSDPTIARTMAAASTPTASVEATVGEDSRTPASQPKQQQQQSLKELRTHQMQPLPAAAVRAFPGANPPTTTSTPSTARLTVPQLLPPLEQSNSPTDRPRSVSGDYSESPDPSIPVATPQARTCAAATAKPALRAGAPPGPALQMTPSYRRHTTALATRRGGAMDIRPPQGFSTSHINDLYETSQSRGSWGFAVDANTLVPPRGLPLPPLPTAVSAPPLHGPLHGQLSVQHWQDRIANVTAGASSSNRVGVVGPGICDGGPAATGLCNVFTSRTRMLNPDQLDSFVVSPSVSTSMATTTAVASIEGSLPAASTAQPWWQPGGHQSHVTVTVSPNRVMAAAEQGSTPVVERFGGVRTAGRPASSVVHAHPVMDGIPRTMESSPAGTSGGGFMSLERHISGPEAADGAGGATGGSPRQRPRQPWWHWLILRRPRGRRQDHKARRPNYQVPSSLGSGDRDADHGSPLVMQKAESSNQRAQSLPRQAREQSDVAASHAVVSSATAPEKPREAAEAADRDPTGKSIRRSGGTNRGRGHGQGRGRFFLSALLHFGLWSGGMAAGIALVLGLAGLVEGTLGGGPVTGPSASANSAAALGGDICGCPEFLKSHKSDGQNCKRTTGA